MEIGPLKEQQSQLLLHNIPDSYHPSLFLVSFKLLTWLGFPPFPREVTALSPQWLRVENSKWMC